MPPLPPVKLSTLDSLTLKPPRRLTSKRGRPKVDPTVGCIGASEQAACRAAAAASPWGPPSTAVCAVLRVCWKVNPAGEEKAGPKGRQTYWCEFCSV